MFPAPSATLLSDKCASHHGTNIIPEISQVNLMHDPLHSTAT